MTDNSIVETELVERANSVSVKLRRFAETGRERRANVAINSHHAETFDEAADLIATLLARIAEAEGVMRATEDGLRQICSGDEGPIILRGAGNKPVKCARWHEAKLLLLDLRRAAAKFLAPKGDVG